MSPSEECHARKERLARCANIAILPELYQRRKEVMAHGRVEKIKQASNSDPATLIDIDVLTAMRMTKCYIDI